MTLRSKGARVLRVRWLGRVPYEEAYVLQRALHAGSSDDHLLLLEHPHVFTLGVRGDPSHVLVDPVTVGAQLVRTDRGGDITYHGPGQLVAYPILDVPMGPGAVPAHVHGVEQVVIDTLAEFQLVTCRLPGYPGVWLDVGGGAVRKICAVGVRVTRGRSMHGLALNVDPDLGWFDRIVPCGISGKGVTSMSAEGVQASMQEVVDVLVRHAQVRWARDGASERQDCVPGASGVRDRAPSPPSSVAGLGRMTVPGERLRVRLRQAGVDPDEGLALSSRKPLWLRVSAHMDGEFLGLQRTVKDLDLVTVCEEAGCPNIFECWAQGTATFMINGERCTRACGYCLVDTRRPLALDPREPQRVAEAVERLGLEHVVVTAVARDDLADGGAGAFAATIDAIRARCPGTAVEVLVPDCKGDPEAISVITSSRPDVFNHNLETVARLQRAIRPSAGYARSLAVLARAKHAGLVTKSGMILGMGESEEEVVGALADLRAVGVEIVTLGQYLRPTQVHLPVARWWTPEEFERLREIGEDIGFAHVQSSPLTRSSYHAREAAGASAAEACFTRSAHAS
ncbi:MAG: lipoyl synthase [Acidimicrobiales bacterium]